MTKDEILAVYRQVYEMTGAMTVTSFDCGLLCDKRCCRTFAYGDASPEERDYGMELYPGEELMLADERQGGWLNWRFLSGGEYDLPSSWAKHEGVYFVGCTRPCARAKRPLRCRLFPYKPILKANGKIRLVLEKGTENYCPLTEDQLDAQARRKLEAAMEFLCTIPKVRELLWWDTQPNYRGDET